VPTSKQRLPAILWVSVTITVATLVPLLAWDALPGAFPVRSHDAIAATPLASVAVVCVLQALVRHVPPSELAKTCALAAAFLFWAANQLWPDRPYATLFNDIAVALFVADVVMPWSRWLRNEPRAAAHAGIDAVAKGPLSQG
jgi:hypothetical protein